MVIILVHNLTTTTTTTYHVMTSSQVTITTTIPILGREVEKTRVLATTQSLQLLMLSINSLYNLSLRNLFISLSSTITTNNKIMWCPLAFAYPSMTNTFNNNKDYNFIKMNLNNIGPTLLLSYLYYPKAWVLKSNNSVMRLTNYSMPRYQIFLLSNFNSIK